MNKRFAATAIVLFCAFFPQPQFAQQAKKSPDAQSKSSGNAPTVDQIISKYVQAIGGAASNQKLTTRVVKGTFVINATQDLSGAFEAYGKAPNKSLVILNFPNMGIVREGYNGEIGWSQEPQEGVRVMTGTELASAKVDSDFYKDIRLREIFPKLVFKGSEKVGDILTHKLEGVSKDGYSETMYFAVQSGLLVRTDSIEEFPSGKAVIEIHYEDYREVDGTKIPFVTHHRSPELNIVFKISEIKHNVPIEDDKFEKPKS
jgi:zinc protease